MCENFFTLVSYLKLTFLHNPRNQSVKLDIQITITEIIWFGNKLLFLYPTTNCLKLFFPPKAKRSECALGSELGEENGKSCLIALILP